LDLLPTHFLDLPRSQQVDFYKARLERLQQWLMEQPPEAQQGVGTQLYQHQHTHNFYNIQPD
jgi:hypothetical protein